MNPKIKTLIDFIKGFKLTASELDELQSELDFVLIETKIETEKVQ